MSTKERAKTFRSYENLLIRISEVRDFVESYIDSDVKINRKSRRTLYNSTFVLLCAQLEAFVQELYTESAHALLDDYVWQVQALVDQALSSFSNPQPFRIDKLFSTIGFPKILKYISWQGTNSKSVTQRLTGFIKIRNSIAHGESINIDKSKVLEFMKFIELFSKSLNEWVIAFSAVTDLGLPERRNSSSDIK